MNERLETDHEAEHYVSFGYFDPLVGRRVIMRLSSEGIRFRAHDASRVALASTPIFDCMTPRYLVPYLGRLNRIELFVHSDDGAKAHRLIEQV